MVDRLFTRDHAIWTLTLIGSVAIYVASHTSLLPPAWAHHAQDVGAVLGFIAAKLSLSPLPSSSEVQ